MKAKDKFIDPTDVVNFDNENFDDLGDDKDLGLDASNPEKEDLQVKKEDTEGAKSGASVPNVGAMKKESAPISEEERNARSVFIKNVHFSATQKELEEHFVDCGPINQVTILKNKMTS
jgi:polyadenylate-binding protein 2